MPFTANIVDFINASLKAGSLNQKRFQPGKYVGVTTILPRLNGKRQELLPAECTVEGEYKMIEPDDRTPLLLYHKIISSVYGQTKKQGYGDDFLYSCTTEMQVNVLADSRKVRLTGDEIEPLIIFGMPSMLSLELRNRLGLSTCAIKALSTNLDKLMVFRQEYPATDYFLKPYHQFFSIRYRIETVFEKSCIEKCLCGEEEASQND